MIVLDANFSSMMTVNNYLANIAIDPVPSVSKITKTITEVGWTSKNGKFTQRTSSKCC